MLRIKLLFQIKYGFEYHKKEDSCSVSHTKVLFDNSFYLSPRSVQQQKVRPEWIAQKSFLFSWKLELCMWSFEEVHIRGGNKE